MKLGISYNLFDGEELLESSLRSVRKEADYINVVYQTVSYFGNPASAHLETELARLRQKGLIDELYCYQADYTKIADKHIFERQKRDIGLKLAKKRGMTHFLSMDTDEYYHAQQLHQAKDFIEENNIECSACSIIEYLKDPQYRIVDGYTFPPDMEMYNYYVPFIMKIHRFSSQHHSHSFPTVADPTRALNAKGKFYLFPIQYVAMHHMSTVRKRLDVKYKNSNLNFAADDIKQALLQQQQDILSWDFSSHQITPDLALFRNKIIKKVPNVFHIPHFVNEDKETPKKP